MSLGMTDHYKAHPDDEGVDHVEIVVVPRYKTSGLSGDEWRTSVRVRFWRKGGVVGERSFTRMENAILGLGQMWNERPELSSVALWGLNEDTCHQYGCSAPAAVIYRLRSEYSERGEGPLPDRELPWHQRRAFCAIHAQRGDCGLEDADANYELCAKAVKRALGEER